MFAFTSGLVSAISKPLSLTSWQNHKSPFVLKVGLWVVPLLKGGDNSVETGFKNYSCCPYKPLFASSQSVSPVLQWVKPSDRPVMVTPGTLRLAHSLLLREGPRDPSFSQPPNLAWESLDPHSMKLKGDKFRTAERQ